MTSGEKVLITGATGFLGRQVLKEALARGLAVRAMVRPGSDGTSAKQMGAEVVNGDLLDRDSVERAMLGCRAVIHSAIGYSNRRKGDSGGGTDTVGNVNLAAAAKKAGVRRVVFCSVLTCDAAESVPHFWNKKLAEDELQKAGVPFVALRPGAFLDQADDFWAAGLRKGKLLFMIPADVKLTFIHSSDVARYLARAVDVDLPRADMRIDLGTDRSTSIAELAQLMSRQLGRPVRPQIPPWPVLSAGLTVAGIFNPWQSDLKHMMKYFRKGSYIANTRTQSEVFGDVPRVEDSVRKYLVGAGLLNEAEPAVAAQ
jgi:uncharacterized protein YbjT (DUF2867 family)